VAGEERALHHRAGVQHVKAVAARQCVPSWALRPVPVPCIRGRDVLGVECRGLAAGAPRALPSSEGRAGRGRELAKTLALVEAVSGTFSRRDPMRRYMDQITAMAAASGDFPSGGALRVCATRRAPPGRMPAGAQAPRRRARRGRARGRRGGRGCGLL